MLKIVLILISISLLIDILLSYRISHRKLGILRTMTESFMNEWDNDEDCCLLLDQRNSKALELVDRLNILSILDDPVKLVWETLRYESASIAKGDLKAATIMASSILSQPSFKDALIDHVANLLKTPLLPATQIRNLFSEVCDEFPTLPFIWATDLLAASLHDRSCPNAVSVVLFDKGYHSLVTYRLSHCLWNKGRDGLARYFQSLNSRKFASDIHPACRIGHSCMIASNTGVVLGETAVIGHDAVIMHCVTLGGTGKESGDRHPKVGNGVYLGAGSTVLGNIPIGDGVVIEAGAVVTKPVTAFTRVSGVPAKMISRITLNQELQDLVDRGSSSTAIPAHLIDFHKDGFC